MRRRTSSSIGATIVLFALVATATPSSALTDFEDATAPLRVSTDSDPRLSYPAGEQQAEPHVAVDPTDPRHLLAGAQEGRYYDGGAQAVGAYVSFDAGATWTGGLLPDLTLATGGPWDRATDPVVAFGPDGTAYFDALALNMRDDATAVVNFTSTDGGLTWEGPSVVFSSPDFRESLDKNWMAVDQGASSPHSGRVYVAYTNFLSGASGSYKGSPLYIAHSDDHGTTWSRPVRAARTRYAQGAVPMVAADGTVYVVYDQFLKSYFRITRSTDGGDTWGKARIVTSFVAKKIPGLRTAEDLPSAALDPATGVIHVAWQDARYDAGDVLYTRSRDGGRTWSTPILVNDDAEGGTQFTPAIAAANGDVHVVWYDSRDPLDLAKLWTVRYAVSLNGGRTFGTNLNLTPTPFDMTDAVDTSRGRFLGDYIGIVATRMRANAVWVDTRFPSVWTDAAGQNDVVTATIT